VLVLVLVVLVLVLLLLVLVLVLVLVCRRCGWRYVALRCSEIIGRNIWSSWWLRRIGNRQEHCLLCKIGSDSYTACRGL
jgi:hypothetical protein